MFKTFFFSFSFILYRREFRFRRAAAPCLNATNASHDFSSDRDVYPWEEEAAAAVIFFLLNGQPNSSRRNRHTLLVDRLLCLYMHREGISIIQWNKNFFLLCICCTLLHHRNSPQKKIKVSSNIGAVLCQIWFVTFDCRHSRVSRDPSNTDHRVKKYKKKSASPGFSLFSHRIFNSSSPSSFLLTLPPPSLSIRNKKVRMSVCTHSTAHSLTSVGRFASFHQNIIYLRLEKPLTGHI
jgi:hypothetical protein